jgi:hypothetical protein
MRLKYVEIPINVITKKNIQIIGATIIHSGAISITCDKHRFQGYKIGKYQGKKF